MLKTTALQPNTEWAYDQQLFAGEGEPPAAPPATDTPPADPPASEPPKTDGEPPAVGPNKPAENQGAPEEYKDFTMPEGLAFDKENATDFLEFGKKYGLSQDAMQELVNMYGTRFQGLKEAEQQRSEEWFNESKKQYKKTDIELANKTLGRFADKEFIDFLTETGLGNHRQMIGVFNAIGKQISEGKFVDTQTGPSSSKPLYGNSPGMYK